MFWDFISNESQRITRNIESALDTLQEKGIVDCLDVVNAACLDENGKTIHGTLSNDEAYEIDEHLTNLHQKHNVTYTDIRYKPNSTSVKAYKKDEYSFLQSRGFEYIYKAVQITLLKTEKIQTPDSLVSDFKSQYIQFAFEKALERENAFHDNVSKVRDNHKLLELIGGKKKSDVFTETFTQAEKITIDELLNDIVKQEKFNRTYANSYLDLLKTN